MLSIGVSGFNAWRDAARICLAKDVAPGEVAWLETENPSGLSDASSRRGPSEAVSDLSRFFRVPKPFLELARLVSSHRDRSKWALLYRTLWRLTHGERHLLELRIDDDVYRLMQMADAVRQDAQRMKALLRFTRLDHMPGDNYITYFRPEHQTLRLAAPYFAQRFRGMNWAILTPDESAFWNGKTLQFGDGVAATGSLGPEELAQLWHEHFRAAFQAGPTLWEPQGEGTVARHWPTLPGSRLLDDLIPDEQRKTAMAERDKSRRSAEDFLPDRAGLKSLRQAAAHCEGCDLYKNATQTVFGEGPTDAKVMLIGEQPGDEEDITGQPFVGPSGQVLNEALAEAGLDRREVYVTNAVKHFKNTPRGKRRLHAKPTRTEVLACRPWLESEIFTLEPMIIVCLGATAAQSLLGSDFRITKQRGQILQSEWAPFTLATWHPSAILRVPDAEARASRRTELVADLQQVVQQLAQV